MATRRKRWFRVYDKVLRKQWSNDELATVVRLLAYLNGRWAREGVDNAEAGRAEISALDVMVISGKRRLDVARKSLERVSELAEMSLQHRGDVSVIIWHKFPELQGMVSPAEDSGEKSKAPKKPPPRHATRDTRHATAEEAEEESAAGARAASPAEPSRDPEASERPVDPRALLNLLGRESGEPDEKAAWLEAEHPQMVVHCEESTKRGKPKTPRECVIPWYRRYLGGDRTHQGAAKRAAERAQALAWEELQKAGRDREERLTAQERGHERAAGGGSS
jgi:hypothetical protein